MWSLLFLITICILFRHFDHDYTWYVSAQDFNKEYWIKYITIVQFMSNLCFQLECPIAEFQELQLIILAVSNAVD